MQSLRGKAHTAGIAAHAAFKNDETNYAWSLTVANQYVASVCAQHALLTKQLEQLVTSSLADNEEVADSLVETAQRLEALFEQIDDVGAALNEVAEKVSCVSQQVKAIEQPSSVRERGASILKAFGFKGKSVAETAAASLWARVPPHVLLDGSAPAEFSERVHGVFKDLQ